MFSPELRCLIKQERGEMLPMPFLDTHLFVEVIVVEIIVVVVAISALMGTYKIAMFLLSIGYKASQYLWSSLTPGNEWPELTLIATSIFAAVMWILAMNELSAKLDSIFEKLNTRVKEKDSRKTDGNDCFHSSIVQGKCKKMIHDWLIDQAKQKTDWDNDWLLLQNGLWMEDESHFFEWQEHDEIFRIHLFPTRSVIYFKLLPPHIMYSEECGFDGFIHKWDPLTEKNIKHFDIIIKEGNLTQTCAQVNKSVEDGLYMWIQ